MTFWANDDTSDDDVEHWLQGDRLRRVHVIELAWVVPMRDATVYAYRLPEETFELEDRFWISSVAVEALERRELGDLVALHAEAGIGLSAVPDLLGLQDAVVASTLDFSGIRLRNATLAS